MALTLPVMMVVRKIMVPVVVTEWETWSWQIYLQVRMLSLIRGGT